jgi:nucleoside-diphosphate-sugar epimerase
MNSDVNYIVENKRIRPEKSEVFRLLGDNTLIQKLTDFKPTYNLDQGLTETCEWFSNPENLIKYKATIYNL